MKYKAFSIAFILYSLFILLLVNALGGSLGAGIILKAGLPSAVSDGYALGSRLMITLAMPSFSGRHGSFGAIVKEDYYEYFYYKKGITIAKAQGHGNDFAKLLSTVMEDEHFEKTEGYEVCEVDLHPSGESAAYTLWENAYIRNQSEQDPDINSLMEESSASENFDKDGPLVLIYHTHTTEAYNTTGENYTSKAPTHSTDNEKNTVAVGKTLKDALQALGIESVHCTERLDTTYDGAYDNSYEMLKEYLEKYPSIKIVIDLHRDSIVGEDNEKYRPVAEIQGIKCAQLMMVVGMSTYAENSYTEDNLRFAIKLTNALESNYPGITRSVMLKNATFNQELSKNSVLIEMGATGNTLTEAKRSAIFLASAIAGIIEE